MSFLVASVVVVLLAPATKAPAATQIGELFQADNLCGPMVPSDPGILFLQAASPGNRYAAPAPGVITGWGFHSGTSSPELKFKAARPLGGGSYLILGESSYRTPPTSTVNRYTDVSIPVDAGDIIGIAVRANGSCGRSAMGYGFTSSSDSPPGTTTSSNLFPSIQLSVSATLEPDCDNDGFGDETQDSDLASCASDTAAPDTTILAGPKDKTKKKTARFEFSGTDARAVGGFQCSLDGGPFVSCLSPHAIKVKRGKHTFSVRAIDQAGNGDPAPATDNWKVKRRKKGRK